MLQSFTSIAIISKSLRVMLANVKAIVFIGCLFASSLVQAQLNLSFHQGTNFSNVKTGDQFIDTINYAASSFTVNGAQNAVATIALPQNLVPYVISPFSNSVAFDDSQVSSVTYNAATNSIKVSFVALLPAGSTGQLQIKFKYINGSTPNGYAPNLIASFNADNYVDVNNAPIGAIFDTVHVIAIAANQYSIDKNLKAGGAINGSAIYKVNLNANNSTSGSLDLSNPIIIDTLTKDAVFVKATPFNGSNLPVYNAVDNTITWTWPSATVLSGYSSSAYVSVKYNAPQFSLGQTVCNYATVKGDVPSLPIGTYSPTSASGNYCFAIQAPDGKADCSGGRITAATASWLDHHVLAGTTNNTFGNGWYNGGNTELDEVNLVYTIDKSIDVNTIKVKPVYDGFDSAAPASIEVKYATNLNQSFTLLGTYQSLDIYNGITPVSHTPALSVGEYLTQVSFKITGSLPIGGYQDLSYAGGVRTAITGAKDGSIIKEGTYNPASAIGDDGTVVHNISVGNYTYAGNVTNYPTCADSAEIIFAQPAFHDSYKSITNADNNFKASDTVGYQFHTYLGGNDDATSVVVSDTLDTKLDYVVGSSTFTIGNVSNAIVPVVTTLSGKTILTYNLGTINPGKDYYINFNAVIHPGTLPQIIPNRFTLTSNNALFTTVTDPVNISIISAVALRAFKGQSGCDPTIVYYPTVALAQEGGPVDYKITLKNLGNMVAKDLVLVDVFPFTSDYRGSQWYANLVGPVKLSDASTKVFYTTTNNPCYSDFTPASNPSGCNTPSWSSNPPVDITTVRGIKITRSANLAVLDSVVLSWPMRAPVGVPAGLIMNNSIEYQVSRADNGAQLLPAVPNKVGMATNCTPVLGSIGNYAWLDTNKNGLQDEPASLGLNGVKVYLYGAGNDGVIGGGDDVLLDSTATANNWNGNPGYYKFVEVPSGNYYLKFPKNYNANKISPVTITTDKTDGNNDVDSITGLSELVTIDVNGVGQVKDNTTIDAGFYPTGSLGNYVWHDSNQDGKQNEPASNGINGVKVYLYKDNGTGAYLLKDSTITANNASNKPGYYNFYLDESGNYKVLFPKTIGSEVITTRTTNAKTDDNSDADTITGLSPIIVMNLVSTGTNKNNPTIDAGYHFLGSLGNYVWYDTNNDGLQNEPAINGINGVKVYLYKETTVGNFTKVDSAITANDASSNPGYYNFANLYDGNFKVLFPKAIGNYPISDVATTTVKTDGNNDVDKSSGFSAIATIYSANGGLNQNNPTIDAGYKTNIGSLGNYVWYDDNNDGLQNEPASNGINGVKVYLYKETTPGVYTKFDSTTTANDASNRPGYYNFPNLLSGNYKVLFPTAVGNYPLSDVANAASQIDGNNDANKATGFSGIVAINTSSATALDVNNPTIDAGYRTNIGSLGNYVWYDMNVDGLQNEASSNGINGVKVYLLKETTPGTFTKVDSTVTANDASSNPGYYNFPDLLTGNYKVSFPVKVNGTPLTVANTTPKTDGNSDADVNTGFSSVATILTSSSNPLDVNNPTIDAGYKPLGSLGNYVWYDYNNDGLQNEPDSLGINGVTVNLYKETTPGNYTLFASTITSNDTLGRPGFYNFPYLQGANYKVQFPTKIGNYPLSDVIIAGTQIDGNNDAIKSTGFSNIVTINPILGGLNRDNPTIDAGYRTNIGSLGNYVWTDTNGDGINNESTTNGLNNVKVDLYKETSPSVFTLFASTFTGNTGTNPGYYSFDNLNTGNYQVHFPTTLYGGNITLQNAVIKTDNNSDANATTGITPTVVINTASITDALDINNPTIDAGYTNVTPPVCNMTASISVNQLSQCQSNNQYVFTGNFSGGTGPYTYFWDFNDGTYGYTQNATHTYTSAGDHDVTFIVRDNRGCDAHAATVQIQVGAKPIASFAINTNTGTGNGYTFVSTSDAGTGALNYYWDLGNGTTSTLVNPGPFYYGVGIYVVKLIAINTAGCIDSVSQTIVVGGSGANCTTPIITASANTICNGSSVLLTSSSSVNNQWTYQAFGSHYTFPISGAIGQTYTATSPGIYAVFVGGGCSVRSINDTINAGAKADFTFASSTVANTPCLDNNKISFTNNSVATAYKWYVNDSLVSNSSTLPDTTFTTANTYNVKLVVDNGSGCSDSITKQVYVYSCSVSSGSGGGLESKSLGSTIGTRNYGLIKTGKNGPVQYPSSELIAAPKKGSIALYGVKDNSLASIMPYQVDASYLQYDKTAAVIDLEDFTNAIDVRAVDFTKNQLTKAVAFATKTLGGVYSHTKPVCDRLRGAQLLKVETIQIQAISFVRYTLKQEDGSLEYAISFSAGTKAGRNTYSIQSNWMTQDYIGEDTLVNYQLWSASPVNVTTMVTEVLSRLNAIKPAQQLSNANDLPEVYITSGTRKGTTLSLMVNNPTNATSGYFEMTERKNENTTSPNVKIVPFTINANAKSTIDITVGDAYDADVKMYLNNKLQDLVYMADGIWGNNYNSGTTNLAQFNVNNDNGRTYNADEYALLRNVHLKATSSDYVSVYKFLRGGAAAQNLSSYQSFKFTTGINTGGVNLRVTLTKQNVSGWGKQFTYLISNVQDSKTYQIGFSEFKTADNATAVLDASDITSVVFSYEIASGNSTTFDANISNVSFSKEDIVYTRTLEVKTVTLSPNPTNGAFKISFASAKDATLNLIIMDITGKVINNQLIHALRGQNNISVQMPLSVKNGMYFVSLKNEDATYQIQRIMVQTK